MSRVRVRDRGLLGKGALCSRFILLQHGTLTPVSLTPNSKIRNNTRIVTSNTHNGRVSSYHHRPELLCGSWNRFRRDGFCSRFCYRRIANPAVHDGVNMKFAGGGCVLFIWFGGVRGHTSNPATLHYRLNPVDSNSRFRHLFKAA